VAQCQEQFTLTSSGLSTANASKPAKNRVVVVQMQQHNSCNLSGSNVITSRPSWQQTDYRWKWIAYITTALPSMPGRTILPAAHQTMPVAGSKDETPGCTRHTTTGVRPHLSSDRSYISTTPVSVSSHHAPGIHHIQPNTANTSYSLTMNERLCTPSALTVVATYMYILPLMAICKC